MSKAQLIPTAGNCYRIIYSEDDGGVPCHFGRELAHSQEQEARGDIEGACNTRFEAFQQLMELIPDSTDMELDWEDANSRDAILLLSFSAIDHFLIGDFEMCAAMLEMQVELDPEDHLEASKRLAYAYVALEEYDWFDEVINDVSDKYADKELLALWSDFRRTGSMAPGELRHFKKNFATYYDEFTAEEHPVDEAYIRDIESEHPSRQTLARELWLQTEHLWKLFPGFIEALKSA
ncbi:MAG: tetratricopeptide repeat protein [Rikenellaceae bacterium]|nr:tetratricopeptide repeat protein [Rikenellaceae bacterium]